MTRMAGNQSLSSARGEVITPEPALRPGLQPVLASQQSPGSRTSRKECRAGQCSAVDSEVTKECPVGFEP